MIVPLEIKIERINYPESFSDEIVLGSEFARASEPTYRVEALAYDTHERCYRSYRFHSMVQPGHSAGHEVGEMSITQGLEPRDKDHLRAVRDELDKMLEDPRSRWDAFSDEELAEIESETGSAQISSEIRAELDHRETRL